MIIGNNIPTGIEKVTIDGEKVREKFNLLSGLEYQYIFIETAQYETIAGANQFLDQSKNKYSTGLLYDNYNNENRYRLYIQDNSNAANRKVYDFSQNYFLPSHESQYSVDVTPILTIDTSSIPNNQTEDFNFNTFQFSISKKQIAINGQDYTKEIYNVINSAVTIHYNSQQDFLFKVEVFEKVLLLHCSTTHSAPGYGDDIEKYDIIAFYPIIKTIR